MTADVREKHGGAHEERFPIAAARERWLEFLPLEHATLPPLTGVAREADTFLVRRAAARGRRLAEGRIPKDHGAALFVQAAAAASFLQNAGLWLEDEDLREASWDLEETSPRLWLAGTPAALRRGGTGPAPSAVLAGFLDRLFGRGHRVTHPGARSLLDRLLSTEAAARRADFWLASAYRAFPELQSPLTAGARLRTLGRGGTFLKSAAARALLEKARALLAGRGARIFGAPRSAVTPGGALGFEPAAGFSTAALGARALRERHFRETEGRRALWIAVEPERWDSLSRRAFEAASRALEGEVDVAVVPAAVPPPLQPDEWRREIFVPCGTLNASLRFYERFASLAQEGPSAAERLAEAIVRCPEWGAFAADPTGDAPIPEPGFPALAERRTGSSIEREILEALEIPARAVETQEISRLFPRRPVQDCLARLEARGEIEREPGGGWRLRPQQPSGRLSPSRREEMCRRWAGVETEPGLRIELLLRGREIDEALAAAQRWYSRSDHASPEPWFALSALLSPALRKPLPAWLEAIEAEREIAGGRAEEGERRLARLERSSEASAAERRAAALRRAEVLLRLGSSREAARQAAAWRRESPDAPAHERFRALVLEARGRAREGEHAAAIALLDEADRVGVEARLPIAERLGAGLARAGVYSLAGRFREEKETYDRWRPAVSEAGDELLMARLLSHEALVLADRREFSAAIARLEEALAASRDDAGEQARLALNLAGTLYHAGRTERCRSLLEEAISLAGAAGLEDVRHGARANRVELLINAGEWEAASDEVEALVSQARAAGDDRKLHVALHHRSRLALRRGLLEAAARDNALARELAEKLSDRLEIGELWIEEGDRLAFEGEVAAARRAYEAAASDPPDRCDTERKARERLREIDSIPSGGPPEAACRELAALFERDEYSAAEQAARWRALFGAGALPERWSARAQRVLRGRGGSALADRVFGSGAERPALAGPSTETLRALREAAAGALAGEERAAPLGALGLAGLALRGDGERDLIRFGACSGDASTRRLDSGASSYELSLWPPPPEEISAAVALVLETLLFRLPLSPPPADFAQGWRRLGVVAADASMEEPYRRLVRFAPAPVTVLVRGESGSGKEAVARAVHALSPRASGPFVAVNVPAIPSALLESELFGHARGAFTGADRDRKGLLEEAERGTIFFDEIGDLPPPMQAKLLRALQEREIRRVGENRPRRLDVRVVSATSRDLEREVESGRFREDLYYRLHVAVIALPALRERGRDVLVLARHFLERCAREFGRGGLVFAPETLAALSSHSWPGNVRELQNAISQAAALAESGSVVGPELLPGPLRRAARAPAGVENYRSRVDEHRRGLITEALERSGGNRSRAARDLGLSRQALLYLIRELHVVVRPRSH